MAGRPDQVDSLPLHTPPPHPQKATILSRWPQYRVGIGCLVRLQVLSQCEGRPASIFSGDAACQGYQRVGGNPMYRPDSGKRDGALQCSGLSWAWHPTNKQENKQKNLSSP